MGGIYYNRKNYDEALEYWKKTLDIYLELGNKHAAGSSMNNIGLVYADMGDLKTSLQYYFRSLSMYSDVNACARVYPYENIGGLYAQLGMTDSANFYLTKALEKARLCKDPMVQIGSLTELAELFRSENQYAKAENFLKEAYQVGREGGFQRETRLIAQALSRLYEETGKIDESLRYFKHYAALGDSLYNDESSKEIGRLEAQYEFEKKQKDREIEQRLEEIEKERQLSRQKWITITFIVGFLLMTVIVMLIYRNYKRKTLANEKLKELNAEISMQSDVLVSQSAELHRLNESLNGLNDSLEKKIEERTEELKSKNEELKNKNQKLAEYSFINAHKLRAPVASILGLIELFDNHNVTEAEKKEIINRIRYSTDDLNGVIKQIRMILEDEGFRED